MWSNILPPPCRRFTNWRLLVLQLTSVISVNSDSSKGISTILFSSKSPQSKTLFYFHVPILQQHTIHIYENLRSLPHHIPVSNYSCHCFFVAPCTLIRVVITKTGIHFLKYLDESIRHLTSSLFFILTGYFMSKYFVFMYS